MNNLMTLSQKPGDTIIILKINKQQDAKENKHYILLRFILFAFSTDSSHSKPYWCDPVLCIVKVEKGNGRKGKYIVKINQTKRLVVSFNFKKNCLDMVKKYSLEQEDLCHIRIWVITVHLEALGH